MIIGIVKNVGIFILIFIVCLCGFAAGFYTLLKDEPINMMGHKSTYFMSVFNSYAMMLGGEAHAES